MPTPITHLCFALLCFCFRGSGESCSPEQSPSHKRILIYFELENRTWRQHFWLFIFAWNGAFWNKKWRNGVPAFTKVAEREGLLTGRCACEAVPTRDEPTLSWAHPCADPSNPKCRWGKYMTSRQPYQTLVCCLNYSHTHTQLCKLKRCVHKLSKLQKWIWENRHWSCGHANG